MRRSAFGSIKIADNLTGLVTGNYLTTDVDHVAQTVPFRFPELDFRNSEFYDWSFEKKIAMSGLVMRKFREWVEQAKPIERAEMAVVALTDTSQFIDQIIEDATYEILKAHQIKFVDHDESHCFITDYQAATDPFKISNALNSVVLSHWIDLFEDQARRVLEAPPISLEQIKFWSHRRDVERKLIEYKIRHNPYSNYGFTIKEGRKVLLRTYNFFASMFGEHTARGFIRGIPLKIKGHYFTWELELEPSNLVHNTLNPPKEHTPYYLRICDHEGRPLADACVCFEDYGVLDQAVSIGLWVSTPQGELDLIRVTNFSNLTKEGIEHDNGIILGFPNVRVPPQLGPMNHLDVAAIREAARGMTGAERLRFYDELHARRLADAEVLRQDDPPWDIGARVCHIDETAQDEVVVETEDWVESVTPDEPIPDGPMSLESYWEREIYRCPYAFERVRMQNSNEIEGEGAPMLRAVAQGEIQVASIDHAEVMNLARQSYQASKWRAKQRMMLNPISRALREELYRRIDVRPDLLDYMADPEIEYHQLRRFWHAPRLEAFMTRKEPLA